MSSAALLAIKYRKAFHAWWECHWNKLKPEESPKRQALKSDALVPACSLPPNSLFVQHHHWEMYLHIAWHMTRNMEGNSHTFLSFSCSVWSQQEAISYMGDNKAYHALTLVLLQVVVGSACAEGRHMLDISYPVSDGQVQDWEAMQKVWDHTFEHRLKLDANARARARILLTEPPLNPLSNRQASIQPPSAMLHAASCVDMPGSPCLRQDWRKDLHTWTVRRSGVGRQRFRGCFVLPGL